jgi:hypothetical protein
MTRRLETWMGTLAEKPKEAKEGVVAELKVKAGDKDTVVNLWADGEIAKELKDMAPNANKVKVTGTKVDAANVKVSKVEKIE